MTAHSENREHLFSLITEWLDGYRESDCGWAAITPEDVNKLYSIVRRLIELKCRADPDGDRPIDIHLIDRTLHWPLQYRDVPYNHKAPDKDVLQALLDNAQVANSQLCDFLRIWSTNKLLKESE